MAKLGTEKNPIILRVQNENRANEVASICHKHGWKFILGIEADKPENISDLERLLNPPKPRIKSSDIGRNDPCPCGSGKKYKKCCFIKEDADSKTVENQKDIPRCGLCGKTTNITKTECCDQWICDDESDYKLFSFEHNSCYRNHSRYTLCGYHYANEHGGNWKNCKQCKILNYMYILGQMNIILRG
jgi:SWIM/SEC-C metal-binding protein